MARVLLWLFGNFGQNCEINNHLTNFYLLRCRLAIQLECMCMHISRNCAFTSAENVAALVLVKGRGIVDLREFVTF